MRFIEVCAGAGGLSHGLSLAGHRAVLLNDNCKTCCETLRRNHHGCDVLCEDMMKLDLTEYRGRIDLLCGGIPCQSWSTAGKLLGLEDARGKLMYKFKELLHQCEPKCFMIENVKGMLHHDKGASFEKIKDLLACDGKYTIHHKILNANDYGVAQKRERLFIVGVSKECPFEFPSPLTHKPTLGEALEGVPDSPGQAYSVEKKKILDMVPEGGCWIDLPEQVQRDYMGKSFFSGGGKRGYAKRLSMKQPSVTLTCSPAQKQTERCHPKETRPLTTREYARVQSFPDEYEFAGSVNAIYKQIGNAVPVMLAYHVGKSLKSLDDMQ